jgi:hypothetical protein
MIVLRSARNFQLDFLCKILPTNAARNVKATVFVTSKERCDSATRPARSVFFKRMMKLKRRTALKKRRNEKDRRRENAVVVVILSRE